MGVMVTGGTGFLGAGLTRLLVERGEEDIVAFDRNPAKKNLDDLAGRVTFIQGDLGIFSHVLEAVSTYRPSIIFHLGAMLTVPSDADPPLAFQANVAGTFHVLEAARLFKVEKILFASSIGSYGLDIKDEVIDDFTVQRPRSMYGVSKVFGENLGRYYKLRYSLDFRSLRYPGIIGPGFRTPSLARYASQLIEESVRGRPFTLRMAQDVKHPLLYFKDAALAMIKLAEAPEADIKMVSYLINGVEPLKTSQELVDMVKARLPEARLSFAPEPGLTQVYYDQRRIDDGCAREEWNWHPEYGYERLMDDFIGELREHPERYV
jgi:threonine 3-dehydrogenase